MTAPLSSGWTRPEADISLLSIIKLEVGQEQTLAMSHSEVSGEALSQKRMNRPIHCA